MSKRAQSKPAAAADPRPGTAGDPEPDRRQRAVVVRGARTHNLDGIDCRVPHRQVTVVTGPSGAGKSSLAFDTVYAEAQRRFVESMSTYARQFLEQMERPPVESIEGILPAVALEARNSIKNARSTVGTVTEVHDVLRLLFTAIGDVLCPRCAEPMVASTPQEIADVLSTLDHGERLLLLADVPRPKRHADRALAELVRQGFFRVWVDDAIERLGPEAQWGKGRDPLPFVLGRYKPVANNRGRIAAAAEEAYKLAAGRLRVLVDEEESLCFGRRMVCRSCGEETTAPVPALFSFNSPLGACDECQGFGRTVGVDRERVIPDPTLTLRQRPIAPWNSPAYTKLYNRLFAACRGRGVSLDVPWQDVDDETRDWIWNARSGFTSISKFFRWLERRNYRVHLRVLLARYRSYEPCPSCGGDRLAPEGARIRVADRTLPEIERWSIERALAWLGEVDWSARQRARAELLLEALEERLGTLDRVGLGYLTLDRQARTLSGGETQRIQLATALGSGLTSTLYVLDEPTIGLHPQDSGRLLDLLHDLAGRGNTVLVVEHDRTLIAGADHVIDLGPFAGERGGRVMAEGTLAQILDNPESLTAQYMQRPLALAEESSEADCDPDAIIVRGARANNLKGFDAEFPLGCLTVVTGISGSGKSTLVERVLHDNYQRNRGVVDVEPGAVAAIEGEDLVDDIVLVDQKPLGRSSRSNPATYTKAYDEIRKLFARQPLAKQRQIKPGAFSFNIEGGRCPRCQGTGIEEVDMQFMAAVEVTCDACNGHRFKSEVLGVTLRGANIAEVLELTVEEACEFFAKHKRIVKRLDPLLQVGLGYLRLGQSTATLSGGEAQRLKLASFLDRRQAEKPKLFLFDEPTTGLHLSDIDLLHRTLRRLTARGDGVVVVEHSLDLIALADRILDLGPGGGDRGGELLFSGSLVEFLRHGAGPTAEALRAEIGDGGTAGAD